MSESEPTELEKIPGIGPKRAHALRVAGYETLADLEAASESELREVEMFDDVLARDIKATVSPDREQARAVKQLNRVTPADWSVTEQQVSHIQRLTNGVSEEELLGANALDLRDHLEWRLDPELLGFKQVCGRVVTYDSDADEYHPVPNATVEVQDTDCSFLSYFPSGLGYGWFFPYNCDQETIATTTTDECGEFCVYVPLWDIDRVLRYRRERICLPDIYNPRIRDVLENTRVYPEPVLPPNPRPRSRPEPVPRPGPGPDPITLAKPGRHERLSELLGEEVVNDIEMQFTLQSFGISQNTATELLDKPAFPESIEPPKPMGVEEGDIAVSEHELATHEGLDEEALELVDFDRYVGPFLKCTDVFLPEWQTFFDVPDITFRVTQDVDNDGTQETIYSEGYFDVRWDTSSIPNVELVADDDAISIPTCDSLTPENLECEEPSIESVGLMTARAPTHDRSTGYATQVNRPKPAGSANRPAAEAPYAGTLQLRGCHRFEEASYYRVLYSYEGKSERAFTNEEWHVPAIDRDPVHVKPDGSEGWYPILDVPYLENYYGETLNDNPLLAPFWFFNWNTRRYKNGKYDLRLELADGNKDPLGVSSPTVPFQIDNRAPHLSIDSIEWAPKTGPATYDWSQSEDISESCPEIKRKSGQTIGIRVSFRAWGEHFRNVIVSMTGCEDHPVRTVPATSSTTNSYSHWHTSLADQNHGKDVVFEVDGNAPSGAYRIRLNAISRAFNPAGGGAGPGGNNWKMDENDVDVHVGRGISITTK